MAKKSEFVSYLLELLEPIGQVSAKAMFGGFGIYREHLMFGLVANDTLYLKVDDENRNDYETRGLSPFTYSRKGKEYAMSYYQAPEETLENSEELQQWTQKAYLAALRAQKKKSRKKSGSRQSTS